MPRSVWSQGHPFDLREGSFHFWSASADDLDATFAYAVGFVSEQANVFPGTRVFPKNFKLRVWCVRGGQGEHP